jgi:diguanylate cyclase (GGDEF)-like protein
VSEAQRRAAADVDLRSAETVDAVLAMCGAEGDLAALALLVCQLAGDVIDCDGFAVEIVDGGDLVTIAGTGTLAGMSGARVPREGSLSGLAIASGEPQLSADTMHDLRVNRAACRSFAIGALAVYPIRRSGHTVAVLNVATCAAGELADADLEALAPLIHAASIRLSQAAVEQIGEAQLQLLGQAASASRDVLLAEDPGLCLVESVAKITGAAHVYLLLPHGQDKLVIARSVGTPLDGMVATLDDATNSGWVFRRRRPKVITNWSAESAASQKLRRAAAAGGVEARSSVYVPLLTQHEPAGVVVALLTEPVTVQNADVLGVLETLAAGAGVAITRDILFRQVAEQARTDPLTGLANRRAWTDRLDLELARVRRGQPAFSLAMLDLDHFKRYNDTHGHPAGDALLAASAAAWAGDLRPTDLLARLGGEEFGVLLPGTDADAASAIVERMRGMVPEQQTVSIGLTTLRPDDDDADAVMVRADEALYAAKGEGRDRIVSR